MSCILAIHVRACQSTRASIPPPPPLLISLILWKPLMLMRPLGWGRGVRIRMGCVWAGGLTTSYVDVLIPFYVHFLREQLQFHVFSRRINTAGRVWQLTVYIGRAWEAAWWNEHGGFTWVGELRSSVSQECFFGFFCPVLQFRSGVGRGTWKGRGEGGG